MYGKRRFSRKSSSRRSGFRARRNIGTTRMAVARRFKPRGRIAKRLNRREIKFDDDYYNLNSWVPSGVVGGGVVGGFVNFTLGGVVGTSSWTIARTNSSSLATPLLSYTPNCLTNVASGNTAMTRIGNMIQPRFITLKGVVTGAQTTDPKDAETLGKDEPGANPVTIVPRFLRTSVKIFLIRDKSMNEKGFVEFSDVFQAVTGDGGYNGTPNPFLWNRKVDTISRYEILKEMEYQLDADDPQKSFTWVVPLKGVAIRYNGSATVQSTGISLNDMVPANVTNPPVQTTPPTPEITPNTGWFGVGFKQSVEAQSMTNGVYVLAVSHTSKGGISLDQSRYSSPSLIFSSRLTFED